MGTLPNNLTLVRRDRVGPPSSLWRVDQLEALVEGVAVGRLRVSYVPRDRVEGWRRDVYAFVADCGSLVGLRLPSGTAASDRAEAAFRVNAFLTGWAPAQGARWAEQPAEAVEQALARWRPALAQRLDAPRAAFEAFHVDKPLVDHLFVEEGWRRRGVAMALYREGARWMAERGLQLHASGVQTPAAQHAWERLTREGAVETVLEPQQERRRLRARW